MCEVCWQHPCHPRCPNAPEPKGVYVCSGCSNTIYEGDDYWDICGEQWCEDCIHKMRKVAEYVGNE